MERKPFRWRHALAITTAALLIVSCEKIYDPNGPPRPDPNDPGNPPSGGTNHPPTSSIVLPLSAVTNQGVVVQNQATDPDGDAIAQYRFRSAYEDVKQASKAATLTFPAAGTQTVYVSAQDSRSAWGPEVSGTISIAEPPPASRVLFADDGTLEPIDIGYTVGYPSAGQFALVTANGERTMTFHSGKGAAGYTKTGWVNVPRGAHIRFRIYFEVDTDPVSVVASDDMGYSLIQMNFGLNGTAYGADYFVFSRITLDSEGFPGSPRSLESYFQPGKQVYDRVPNKTWQTMDIDLDRLVATRFASSLNMGGFNQISFRFNLRDVHGLGYEYRMKQVLDSFEIYVP